MYELIRELASDGAGMVIVSSEAKNLCDVVHIMRDGTIVQTSAGADVTETSVSRATVEGAVRRHKSKLPDPSARQFQKHFSHTLSGRPQSPPRVAKSCQRVAGGC